MESHTEQKRTFIDGDVSDHGIFGATTVIHRRDALKALLALLAPAPALAQGPSVSTLIGTGVPADTRIGRSTTRTGWRSGPTARCTSATWTISASVGSTCRTRRTLTVAGNGQQGYSGDGGPATSASLNMPHEIQFDAAGHLYIAERDNHVIRKVDAHAPGPSPRSPARGLRVLGRRRAGRRRAAAPAAQHRGRSRRAATCSSATSATTASGGWSSRPGVIDTFAGTGERQPTPDGAPLPGTPLNGPRTMAFDAGRRPVPGTARGQRHLPHRCRVSDAASRGGHGGAGILGRRRPRAAGTAGWAEGAGLVARRALHRRHREPRHPRDRAEDAASSAPCSAPVSRATARNPIPAAARWLGRTACWWMREGCSTWATARPTGFERSDELIRDAASGTLALMRTVLEMPASPRRSQCWARAGFSQAGV